jgi:hypothetical protein
MDWVCTVNLNQEKFLYTEERLSDYSYLTSLVCVVHSGAFQIFPTTDIMY